MLKPYAWFFVSVEFIVASSSIVLIISAVSYIYI